jgi:hypothetical protein
LRRISRSVFGEVFAFVETLTVPARRQLSALLAAPGQPLAILPRQFAWSWLPADAEARAEIRWTVEAGITDQTIKTLARQRLGAIVPALVRCDPDEPARSASPAWAALVRKHVPDSAPLAAFTLRQISGWPGVGPRRVAQLIGTAVGAAMDVVGQDQFVPLVANPIPDDIRRVIAYDAARGGQLNGLLVELGSAGPPDVAGAAHRLLFWSKVELDRCLTALTQALAAAGDERDRGVFENLVLPLGPSATRPELAAGFGIGAERVRQLAVRATARVAAGLDQAPAAIGELAAELSKQLGSAAPGSAADGALAAPGLPGLPDTRSRLLLWMAGPYHEVEGHPGWVAIDPAGLIAQTHRLIHQDGGVRPTDHVGKELRAEGVVAEHVESWLARQRVRIGDGLLVATSGSAGDIAERVLHAHGRAMTVDEIAEWFGIPHNFGKLRSTPDQRFVVTGGHALALAEWGP